MKHSIKEWLGNYTMQEVPVERRFAYATSVIWILFCGCIWGFIIALVI